MDVGRRTRSSALSTPASPIPRGIWRSTCRWPTDRLRGGTRTGATRTGATRTAIFAHKRTRLSEDSSPRRGGGSRPGPRRRGLHRLGPGKVPLPGLRSFRRGSSPEKGTLGSPARLQAPSQRLAVATTFFRVVDGAGLGWTKGRALRCLFGVGGKPGGGGAAAFCGSGGPAKPKHGRGPRAPAHALCALRAPAAPQGNAGIFRIPGRESG